MNLEQELKTISDKFPELVFYAIHREEKLVDFLSKK